MFSSAKVQLSIYSQRKSSDSAVIMWKQVGPGKYAKEDSSPRASLSPVGHHQPTMSRSEITSLINSAVEEVLMRQALTSSSLDSELTQKPSFSADLYATVKELSDDLKDFKRSTLKRLEDNENRLEKLCLRCDRVEKSEFDETHSLNNSFKKLQEEFRDFCTKITKRVEEVEGNLKSQAEKEIKTQRQRDNPRRSELQKLTQDNVSKIATESTSEMKENLEKEKFNVWTRETESDDYELDDDFGGMTEGFQNLFKSDPRFHQSERSPESMLEYPEQMQAKESKPNTSPLENVHEQSENLEKSMSPPLELKIDVQGNMFIKIPISVISGNAEQLLKSLDSRLEDGTGETRFIQVPIAQFLRDAEQELMSLDARLEYDNIKNQFIKIPNAAFSGGAKPPMSLDSELEDGARESGFITMPIADFLGDTGGQLMSLDARLETFTSSVQQSSN